MKIKIGIILTQKVKLQRLAGDDIRLQDASCNHNTHGRNSPDPQEFHNARVL